MSTWQAFLKALTTASLYKRKIFLFVPLILAVVTVLGLIASREISAVPVTGILRTGQVGENLIHIYISPKGQVKVGNKKIYRALLPSENYDVLKYKVLDTPGFYISNLEVLVHLPSPVEKEQVKNRIYLINSLNAGSNISFSDEETIVFKLTDLSPSATLSVESQLPAGVVSFPWYLKIYFQVYNFSALVWLLIGLSLPALTLLVLLFVIWRRSSSGKLVLSNQMRREPPQNIPPAVVGTLPDGKVGSREIAATLIDLAARGFLDIYVRGSGFTIGQRRGEQNKVRFDTLKPFEKTLFSKIFKQGIWKVSKSEIEQRIAHHIFSRKIAKMFWEIYQEATDRGFFEQNPGKIHQRFSNVGYWFFFLGVLGFFLGAAFAPEPKFILLFWVGEILASLLIIRLSPSLPVRTAKGTKVLQRWLEFRNFLSASEPFVYSPDLLLSYQKYLPYAIVLGCEKQWTLRFQKFPFVAPRWYDTPDAQSDLPGFTKNIFRLIGEISASLALSHEPTIE